MRDWRRPPAALFLAVGKPRLHSILQFIQAILLFTLIYPLMDSYGLVGVSLAVAFSCFRIVPLHQLRQEHLGHRFLGGLRSLIYPLTLIACSIGSTALVRTMLFPAPDLLSLFILLGIYALVTLVVINAFDRYTPYKAVSMVRGFASSRRKAF